MGIYINEEYFENFTFSDDADKNVIMGNAYIRECELVREYGVLDARYENWVLDSCRADYNGYATIEEAEGWKARMSEIQKELDTLLDGTGITKEEYENAKKKLD